MVKNIRKSNTYKLTNTPKQESKLLKQQRRKQMALTKLKHHDKCPVSINLCKKNSAHYAALHCEKHNTHIQWLSKTDVIAIKGKLL